MLAAWGGWLRQVERQRWALEMGGGGGKYVRRRYEPAVAYAEYSFVCRRGGEFRALLLPSGGEKMPAHTCAVSEVCPRRRPYAPRTANGSRWNYCRL